MISWALWFLSQILGVIILLVAALYIYFKCFIFHYWKKQGVPGPEPTFPFGNVMPYVKRAKALGELTRDVYDEYKYHRLIGYYIFFEPNLALTDLDLIKDVLVKEFSSFHDRGMYSNEKIDPLSCMLFQMSGKKWRNLRIQMTPIFTSGKMKQIFYTVKECGDALSKFVQCKVEAGEPIDVKDVLSRYSTDIVISSAFGINCNSMENPDNEFRYWSEKMLAPRPITNAIAVFAPHILDFLSMPYTPKGVTKFFMETFRKNVEYRETYNFTRKDFVNLLMQLMRNGVVDADVDEDEEEDAGNKEIETSIKPSEIRHPFTMREATAQALLFLLAGFETSSSTSSFCLFELAVNQDIQDKVRAEIRTVLQKHGELTYAAVNEMTYLHKVVCETMRKYPAISVVTRICTKEIDLPTTNLRIREGTRITIPVYGIHWDSRYYPEPEKFDPERFSEKSIAARHPFAYLPFGAGPRICIGARFALIQVKVALINILHKYKVKLSPKMTLPLEIDKGVLITTPVDVHLIAEPA